PLHPVLHGERAHEPRLHELRGERARDARHHRHAHAQLSLRGLRRQRRGAQRLPPRHRRERHGAPGPDPVHRRELAGPRLRRARAWRHGRRRGERYFDAGSATRPMKRTRPDRTSRRKNRKGWSALNSFGWGSFITAPAARITTAVAAAASVPFSSILTKALWKTSETQSRSSGLGGLAMPVKSAFARSNASGMPMAARVFPSARGAAGATSTLGSETMTSLDAIAPIQLSKTVGVRRASTASRPSTASGSTKSMA